MSLSATIVLPIIMSTALAISSIFNVILANKARWRAQGETIRHCYEFLYNKEFIDARYFVNKEKRVINNIDFSTRDTIPEDDRRKVMLVVTTFQHWGFLVKEKYLPLYMFIDSDIGQKVIRDYTNTEPYIKFRRTKSEEPSLYYAEDFEKLHNAIMAANGKGERKAVLDLRHWWLLKKEYAKHFKNVDVERPWGKILCFFC